MSERLWGHPANVNQWSRDDHDFGRSGMHEALVDHEGLLSPKEAHERSLTDTRFCPHCQQSDGTHSKYCITTSSQRRSIERSLDEESAADADLLERVLIAELDDRSGWWPTDGTEADGDR